METKEIQIIEGKYGKGECSTCKHVEDDVDICTLRKCVNAIYQLKQAYEPDEDKVEGRWFCSRVLVGNDGYTKITCSLCGERSGHKHKFCPNCGARMAAGVEEKK